MYDDVPELEPWAEAEMEREGMDIDEYCNDRGYNIEDILKDPDDD